MSTRFPKETVLESIRRFSWQPPKDRPQLLFGSEDLPELRRRAKLREGLLQRASRTADELLATPTAANELQPYISGGEAVTIAGAYVLTGNTAAAAWAKRRIEALLAIETWFSPVHKGGCRVCDHVMANVAAHVAVTHDLLGDRYSASETAAVAAGLRRLHFEPFMDATADQPEWWFKPGCESNWKIMTCGETGLATLGFLEHWPHADETLARAAQGVIEILDKVPAEGDWPEGVGYWFGTLWMGLRYARALRRLSRGEIDLFQHPALKVTGDFPMMLTTPSGRVYNFNDNVPQLGDWCAEALAMLATERRRGDWMNIARRSASDSPLFLACDDPAIPSEPPAKTLASFPRTGVATLRSGWQPGDTSIGFKSGPSDVGHSHLDANSFVLEAGGQTLLMDQSYWPQAHFLGFFDSRKHRWNFDGQATVGHSTILVDGQGQTWGKDFPGRIVEARDAGAYAIVSGDASRCYPGLLKKFIRTLLFLKPDALVVRDVIECEGERGIEWLLQYAGTIRSEGVVSVIENGGVRLTVTPFLPDRHFGWRWSDVERTSVYECSDTRKEVTRPIRFRSFSPFRKAETFEFLFGLRVNGNPTGDDWKFEASDGGWRLRVDGYKESIGPEMARLEAGCL